MGEMEMMKQMITAHLMDRPGALNRVVSLVRRRGLNLESLNVARTAFSEVSLLTMVVEVENAGVLSRQLERLIDVLDVTVVNNAGEPQPGVKPPAPMVWAQADGVVA
jgi:acetolactate synthase-1/3 small subunit